MSTGDENYFTDTGEPVDVSGPPTPELDDEGAGIAWPDAADSPVVPLGYAGELNVFLMPEGNIRTIIAQRVGQALRTDIFVCRAGAKFLKAFCTPARGDEPGKFLQIEASKWFTRECRARGMWDLDRPQRSVGVWPDGPLGQRVTLHLGDEIWRVDAQAQGGFDVASVFDALKARSGPIWRLAPPTRRPAPAASVQAGRWVRGTLDHWRFEAIGEGRGEERLSGGDVLAGWVMAALLGAVPPFRGHLILFAMAGSGKTRLMLFVHALMSVMVEEPLTAFSVPGLRSALADFARAVLIDEAEKGAAGDGPSLVEQALDVLRPMATGDGGNRKMGDIGGKTKTQSAQGSALLGATKPPMLGPADATRFAEIKLLPLVAEAGSDWRPASDAELEAATARAKALAPALLGRAVQGAGRYVADVALLKAGMTRDGHAPRTADLIAMLAAGHRLLLHDAPLTPESAQAVLARWAPLLSERAESEAVSNDGADLLAFIFNAPSGKFSKDRNLSIGDVIDRAIKDTTYEDWGEVLARFGLRVELHGGEINTGPLGLVARGKAPVSGHWLLVANGHPGMEALLARTEFGDWRRTLSYLEQLGPEHGQQPVRPLKFGVGPSRRSLGIPLAPWIGDGTGGVSASPGRETPGGGRVSASVSTYGFDPDA